MGKLNEDLESIVRYNRLLAKIKQQETCEGVDKPRREGVDNPNIAEYWLKNYYFMGFSVDFPIEPLNFWGN